MNNRKYNILLAKTMMLPFTQTKLNDNDYFYNYAFAYDQLIGHTKDRTRVSRQDLKKAYQNALDDLMSFALDDDRWNHVDDFCKILDMFFPANKLASKMDVQKKDIYDYYIQYILDISRVFITFRDGNIAIRNWSKETDPFLINYSEYEKIDLWSNIIRTAVSDLFLAAAYVNFNVDDNSIFNVPNLVSLADMPLRVILKEGVADTHLHANAGISYEAIWHKQMQFDITKEKRDKSNTDLWFCTFFRYYSAMFIKSDNTCFEHFIFNDAESDKKFLWFVNLLQGKKEDINFNQLKSFITSNDLTPESVGHEILFNKFYPEFKSRNTSAEIIWYIDVIKYLKSSHDSLLANCFMRYVRYKNLFFSNKIQSTRIHGLDYFTDFFDNATDTQLSYDTNKYYYIFEEQFKYDSIMILEMKISPRIDNHIQFENRAIQNIKRKTLNQIKCIMNSYKKYLDMLCVEKDTDIPQLGIIYHFIKIEDSDNFNGINCIFANEQGGLNSFDYNSMRRRYSLFIRALNELIYDYPILSDYVVGIDAAAKENATEPWVFAPIFKIARSSKKLLPYAYNKSGKTGNIQNLGFTYHVGEDFRHIVSGLRHIDEVLTHFDYRSGDRLGHAIALGVDIDYLISINSIVAVPIMEHLENLLWMWQYVNNTGDVGNIPDNLEYKIMDVAKQIYNNNVSGLDVYTLWRVYQDKFKTFNNHTSFNISNKAQCSILKKLNSNQKWEYEELLMSHFCPCFYESYHKPIFVQMNTNVEFYKELQSSLIKKVERMGIYVETNPTSNTVIGDIPSIFDHPILRLNNCGLDIPNSTKSSVLVSINSDDPVVFSTHVENEIAYIYYSLLNAGCKREEALEWINKIRMHGINSSFIKNKNRSLSKVLEDIESILSINMN